MTRIDLTHTFSQQMPVYPGDPLPEFVQVAFLDKHGYNDFQIKTGMHVGTHMDAPLHMIENGKRLSEYPVEKFFGEGYLLDARGTKAIGPDIFDHHQIKKGDIVLIMTGFSLKFGQPEYYESHPEITEACASKMVELGIKIVGIDTPSPDRPPFAVHKLLLKNDILIIENLTNLETLLKYKRFEVIALPAKFEAEAAPVRVVADAHE
ncbi:MAG TPA: cyclase family protein [Candidatus Gracilibacteria bacterium]|nr:cyclase family protein [Candidatus Gracilibacteria bacterium]